jgi:hypothetical protein
MSSPNDLPGRTRSADGVCFSPGTYGRVELLVADRGEPGHQRSLGGTVPGGDERGDDAGASAHTTWKRGTELP